jgi:lipid II:glycine glycyltransferase (peptidoglycan interpeptide bridge formation enzyme)
MLIQKRKRFGIPYDYVWFAPSLSAASMVKPVVYMQCLKPGSASGHLRQTFYTKLIDLKQGADAILSAMSRSTSYQVKRAMREGVTFESLDDIDQFLAFYNEFTRTKNLGQLTAGDLDGWGKEVLAFVAKSEDKRLAMHSYIVDAELGRVRMLHSASHFRESEDSSHRNAVGRANRYLHYAIMLHFKELGFSQYDFGGYAKGSSDPTLQAIARFKDGFGGELVREDRFVSLPMHTLQTLGGLFHKARKSVAAR